MSYTISKAVEGMCASLDLAGARPDEEELRRVCYSHLFDPVEMNPLNADALTPRLMYLSVGTTRYAFDANRVQPAYGVVASYADTPVFGTTWQGLDQHPGAVIAIINIGGA